MNCNHPVGYNENKEWAQTIRSLHKVLSSTKTTSNNGEVDDKTVNAVFNISELREMIISRAVYTLDEEKPVLCRKTVSSLRLLSKEWLLAVSKILRKDKEPMFQLVVKNTNSLNGTRYVQRENGKLLDNFVNRVYSTPWNQECKPTFSLRIKKSFFRAENYNSLLNCLQKCGKDLLNLEIVMPLNGGSLTCVFPALSLPSLQTLTVILTKQSIERDLDDGENLVGYSANITNFVSSLLNASSALSKMTISGKGEIPASFQFITLPSSITILDLSVELTSEELGILIRNRLPNLSNLSLRIPEIPFVDGLMFQVLDNYKTTLERLDIKSCTHPLASTFIRFPEMKKLITLSFIGNNCQLEPGVGSLELCLPVLTELILVQSETGLRKWTESSKFAEVKELRFVLLSEEPYKIKSINLQNMQILHQAFPNVENLTLMTNSSGQTCGIKYLFMEMQRLRKLKFLLDVVDPEQKSDYWDALLTGVTEELIKGLRLSPELWEMVSLENVSMPSIRMLQALEEFALESTNETSTSDTANPLISDLAFIHAFLKMPELNDLSLKGRFKASPKMRDIWESKGKDLY